MNFESRLFKFSISTIGLLFLIVAFNSPELLAQLIAVLPNVSLK